MITEQELALALELNKQIRDLKVLLAKLEETKISRSASTNDAISIDGHKIEVDDYSQNLLEKFKEDVIHVHRLKLKDLQDKYADIIESPTQTLRRIIEEDGQFRRT